MARHPNCVAPATGRGASRATPQRDRPSSAPGGGGGGSSGGSLGSSGGPDSSGNSSSGAYNMYYTDDDFRDVGKAFCVAMLDLELQNPWDR